MDPSFTLCYACLSSDRTLYPLGENANLFYKIFDKDPMMNHSTVFLCWECTAVLRKVKLFKEKVDHAQSVLSYHYLSQNIPPISLSTLSIKKIDIIILIEDFKAEVTVKQETYDDENLCLDVKNDYVNQSNDYVNESNYYVNESNDNVNESNDFVNESNDYVNEINDYVNESNDFVNESIDFVDSKFEPSDYVHLEDIKTEDKKLILKITNFKELKIEQRRRGERRYKKIDPKNVTYKTVTIPCYEAPYWMETDRRSEYFKKCKHKCEQCVKTFSAKRETYHWKSWHSSSRSHIYTCDICTCTVTNKSRLKKHMSQHTQLRVCTLCDFKCYLSSYMHEHLIQHRKNVQCVQCLLHFPSVQDFSKHYRDQHKLFHCDNCPKKCGTKKTLEKHMIGRHLPIVCKPCNQTFKNCNNYKNHINLKHVTKMTEEAFCVPCNRQFKNPTEYRNHIHSSMAHRHERNHKIKKEKIPCPECPKSYMKRQSMLNHWRFVHKKESKYCCEHCGVQVLNHTKLVDHVRYKHEGAPKEKNHLCTICGRGFHNKRILRHHIRTHTGERPYHCGYCSAKFAQRSAMQSHVKFVHLKAKRKPNYGEYTEFSEMQQ